MGRHNYAQELEYDLARGLDTTSPTNLLAPGYVRQALNCNLGATGGYIKRDGCLGQLSTPWSTNAITAGIEYRKMSGTTQQLVFGGSTLGVVSGGAVTPVVTGITGGRVAFAQIDDRLYALNGDSTVTPFVYEGDEARSLGLAAPVGFDNTDLTASTGGALEEAPYILAYTYALRDILTQRIVTESSPSDLATITLTSGQNRVILGVVGSGVTPPPTLEVIIRIWRTVGNGSILFLQSTHADGTVSINCDLADAGLDVQQIEFDNSQLDSFEGYAKAQYPVIARNRLFVAHENRNEVRFSKIGRNGPQLESFPALNYASVEGIHGAADKVVGQGQINGVPIILKERSIGRLEEVGLPDIAQSEDLVTYIYREISQTIGAITHFAQCQVFDELVFLGKDNVYATNGQTIRPIAPLLQATIRALDFRANNRGRLSMINDTKFRRIYIQVFAAQGDSQPTLTLVGDYQQYPEFRWTMYGAGSDATTHPGFRVGSFFQFTNTVDGSVETYFGNSNGDGQFYKMNEGTFDDDNGTERGIFFKVISRPYTMGQPLIQKLFKNVRIFAQAENDTYQLDFCSIFDLSVEEEFCQQFTIVGVGNKWDEHNWVDDAETEADPLVWAGPALAELTYDPHRKAKFMQLVFEQTEKDAPVTLLGWGVSGSIFSGL